MTAGVTTKTTGVTIKTTGVTIKTRGVTTRTTGVIAKSTDVIAKTTDVIAKTTDAMTGVVPFCVGMTGALSCAETSCDVWNLGAHREGTAPERRPGVAMGESLKYAYF